MLGVDRGSYSLKLAAFQQNRLTRLSLHKYPDWPNYSDNAAAALLSRVVAEQGAAGESAWTNVKGTSAIAQVTEFPEMSDDELDSAVRLEVGDLLSQDVTEIDSDYDIIETLEDGRMRVLLVAAPRALGQEAIEFLSMAGLYCAGVSLDSVALASLFLETTAGTEPPASVLVNVGATTTNIVLQTGGKLRLLRDVEGGSNSATKELMRETGMSFEEAEEMKTREDEERPPVHGDRLQAAIQPVSRHIARTVAYETRQGEHMDEFEIYLAGGGSRTRGLFQHLAEEFEVPVNYFDPFENVQADCALPEDVEERCLYGVAVGNGLMGAGT